MRIVPRISPEQENHRSVDLMTGGPVVPGITRMVASRRDPVEPVPVGTYVAKVFRVTGYDQDCDGSLMARLAGVDRDGQATGWEPTHLGLYPSSSVVLESPDELHRLAESE